MSGCEPLLKKNPLSESSTVFAEDLEVGDYSSIQYSKYGSTPGSFSSLDTLKAEQLRLDVKKILDVPQGRHLGVFSTMVLFISRILGSGIFSVPSKMFVNCGGNMLIFFSIWVLTAILAFAGLYLFLEFGSWIPKSGGKKNFLEQTYKKPGLMMSVTFAGYSVLTGLCLSSSIIFGKYSLDCLGFDKAIVESVWSKVMSIFIVLAIILLHGLSVKRGVWIQNSLGVVKLVLVVIMCLTGLYALFFYEIGNGPDGVIEPVAWNAPLTHFQDQTVLSLSSIASALISSFFCFSGWDSVHAVASEIKNPTRTLKIAGPFSLIICLVCYVMMNMAYLKILTYEEIKQAGPLIGSVLFSKIFGAKIGSKLVSMSIALSAVSNIMVVVYGTSRMNQEIFREGYFPFSDKLVRNWPHDAPLPAILVCGLLTITWIIILPGEGSSFDYLISMEGYGNQLFLLLIALGLFLYRSQHKDLSAPIKANSLGVIGIIIISIYMLIAPFFGNQTVNQVGLLPPYQIMSLIIVNICILFWLLKFVVIPRLFGYKLLPKTLFLNDGLSTIQWTKKYFY
ncbi:hypothetical protein NCAS_0C05940 [Naumovozyma castellii]|uniref:Amino acid permease/ SLC12A domain-containing protein n=1 Tax=Naumovozyma castellii TaxID=27288 RepID=G0VDM2_NAUCA|nr:hypothetical protein NCAS_0C05940 [Naumovozyma castellii CBS 4309]CCC69584.1 hypothetical protein NCAS_0C05940 [Naumovozyma castellii CBS 4309]